MGLLTILKKMREREKELRLLMLGLDNAGKTTLLKRFNGEDVSGAAPTLGFNIKTLQHRGVLQRLAGATLLVLANKQDLPGALPPSAIREVGTAP
ncbi:ADP-ribosylation factor-like protein 2 [Meleagris gallopavo]|uniref:ADP-ribosylation factor-like protein 2 n=1 Tax=Meleagris gallopavo TaxID=9103 RepID=UPI0012AB8F70|nr:ADP-ribosylation factor-like protein 2 [Meleagris gallopavo]